MAEERPPWRQRVGCHTKNATETMPNNSALVTRARAVDTIPLGGLLIGLFDLLFAFTFYGLILGVPLLRIFQSVAAGVLGRPRAYAGGVPTFLLGIVLHFVVATCIAAVY